MTIVEEILAERERQKELGMEVLGKTNTKNDWVAYVMAYAGRAVDKCERNVREHQHFRPNMIKAAALCVAAIEAYDASMCIHDNIEYPDTQEEGRL